MYLVITLTIILLSFLTFQPSFNLGLFGDDWLAFWRYMRHLESISSGEWNHLTYYLTPYGAQDILMGLLQKIYGYNSTLYYITSYFLRMLAAFSFYPLIFFLTKNKLATFFAILFFSITTIGFDTTNWVFNMPSYITIALFNLSLYFFLKSREDNKPISLIISGIFYYFAYITTPIRMHGSLPFILLLESFWVLQNRNFKTIKKSTIRFAIFLAIFLIIRYTGDSQGPPQEISERFNIGITAISTLLGQGRFDFLFYPIVMFGSMLVPDIIGPNGQINALRQLLPLLVATILIFSLFVFFIMKNTGIFTSKLFGYILFSQGLWSGLVALIYKGNLNFFNSTNQIFSLLVGGYTLILIGFLIIKFFKEKYISQALFLGASWSIVSFFFAWWWIPTTIFPTTYRYLIVSSVGVSIMLSVIIALGKDKAKQRFLFIIFSFIIILHLISTRLYLNFLLASHSQEISNKIWSLIPKVSEIGKGKNPIIFYFEGDRTNGNVIHDVITFGFPPHIFLLYNLSQEDPLPIPMSRWEEVVSAVRDGKTLPAYGYPAIPTTPDRIFAFILQGQDNLINVTDLARQRLKDLNP